MIAEARNVIPPAGYLLGTPSWVLLIKGSWSIGTHRMVLDDEIWGSVIHKEGDILVWAPQLT